MTEIIDKTLWQGVNYKNLKDIKNIKELGSLLNDFYLKIEKEIKVGTSLKVLEYFCEDYLYKHKLESGIKGYQGFNSYICTSVNSIVAHGVPNRYLLKNGDLVTIDTVFKKDKYFVDSAMTFKVGEISPKDAYLLKNSKEVFELVLSKIKYKDPISQIGKLITEEAKKRRINVFYQFCSHGTGFEVHEPPRIKHIPNGDKTIIENGLVFTIEPIFTLGSLNIFQNENNSYESLDNNKSVQFEHTLVVENGKIEIAT